jgi:hypothetical protein
VKADVWTDGSCNANGIHGRGGWAALIEQAGTVREISGSAHDTTHNRMELTAICEALETLTGPIDAYVEKCFNPPSNHDGLRRAQSPVNSSKTTIAPESRYCFVGG